MAYPHHVVLVHEAKRTDSNYPANGRGDGAP
jgi:hypothetical protein